MNDNRIRGKFQAGLPRRDRDLLSKRTIVPEFSCAHKDPTNYHVTRKRQIRTDNQMDYNYHSITAAPQVRPAPKTINSTRSPRRIFPEVTASSSAIATEAADVLP